MAVITCREKGSPHIPFGNGGMGHMEGSSRSPNEYGLKKSRFLVRDRRKKCRFREMNIRGRVV
jgi:hypothetical protein